MLTWKTTKADFAIIQAIVARGFKAAAASGRTLDRVNTLMDIEEVHERVGLDLQKFLDFPDFDFNHDFFGIIRHVSRESDESQGTLGAFLPRCAKPKVKA